MPIHRRHFASVVGALFSFVRVEPAWACGAALDTPPCVQLLEAQPTRGSVWVPRNPELRVRYSGSLQPSEPPCPLDLTVLRLVPREGRAIELIGALQTLSGGLDSWVTARVDAPLMPYVTYALQVPMGPVGQVSCGCEGREWTTVTDFTVGPDEDHRAPSFDGLDGLSYDEPPPPGPCGGSDDVPVVARFQPGSDDSRDELRYDVYVDGALVQRFVRFEPGYALPDHALLLDCADHASGADRVPPGAMLEIRAVDVAGNESAPRAAVQLASSCEAAEAAADGCALAPRRAGGALAPLALGALGTWLGLARWRRRGRRGAA